MGSERGTPCSGVVPHNKLDRSSCVFSAINIRIAFSEAVTVTPDTREELSIALAPTVACEADSAVCTADGRALSIGAAHLVSGPGPEELLTASFEGVPEAHDGQSAFSFRVAFSEDIGTSFKVLRDESFMTTGGALTGARRVDGRNDLWEITVEPSGAEKCDDHAGRGPRLRHDRGRLHPRGHAEGADQQPVGDGGGAAARAVDGELQRRAG